MKTNKIILILIALAVIGIGFYFFQKYKQEKDLIAHNKRKFQNISAVAKQSNTSGLLVMASAINNYYKGKGYYPKSLLDLYPDFVADKSFITMLNWQYSQTNRSYLIKRSLEGQNTFASMGPDLKLKTGIVDSPETPKAIASLTADKTIKFDINTVDQKSMIPSVEIKKETLSPQIVKKKNPSDINELLRTQKKLAEGKNIQQHPSTKMIRKKLDENEKFLLSFDSNKLYIWKTDSGTIGFSNIQYPDREQLAVYRDQGWDIYIINGQADIINRYY